MQNTVRNKMRNKWEKAVGQEFIVPILGRMILGAIGEGRRFSWNDRDRVIDVERLVRR
jgi:hypothetical protein